MIPLYGFLEGDTLGLLIVIHGEDTVKDLIERVQQAAQVRVAPRENLVLKYHDEILDHRLSIASVGFQPLERFDVVVRR